MSKIKRFLLKKLQSYLSDATSDKKTLFIFLNATLAVISGVMSVLNIFTQEYILLIATGVFAILCAINAIVTALLHRRSVPIAYAFAAESLALIIIFIVTGIPDGFSVLWTCLLPPLSLFIFGKKKGSIYCLVTFIILIFFFWIPFGKGLLQHDYGSTFMLRFPFLFGGIYALSILIELVHEETIKKLSAAEEKYKKLYRHDELTKLYNRYGFLERTNKKIEEGKLISPTFMILDIDNFKKVNDTYGHLTGDTVLKHVADVIDERLNDSGCIYCRWGGEEFTMFIYDGRDCATLAEELRNKIQENSVPAYDKEITVTVSVGICSTEREPIDITRMLIEADKCLYKAKSRGKNKVICTELE